MLQVEESILNIGKFNNVVKLSAFYPFKSAQTALENINAISEGEGVGREPEVRWFRPVFFGLGLNRSFLLDPHWSDRIGCLCHGDRYLI